jgi:hypothetical protein
VYVRRSLPLAGKEEKAKPEAESRQQRKAFAHGSTLPALPPRPEVWFARRAFRREGNHRDRRDAWSPSSAPDRSRARRLRRRRRLRSRGAGRRPATLSDACWTSPTTRIDETFGYQLAGQCETLYPTFGDTRTAAGGSLAGTAFKCQLTPLDFASYSVAFTPAQQARLQAAFPTGVCDWSKPGVDERPPLGTWLDYGS